MSGQFRPGPSQKDVNDPPVYKPIAQAGSTSPTLVLRYQTRSILVPRPASYQDAVALVQKNIPQLQGEIRFLGRVPQVDEEVEISADAWTLVIKDMQYLRIEMDSECGSELGGPPALDTPLHQPPSLNVSRVTPRRVLRKPIIYIYPPTPIDLQVQLALTPQWQFSAIYPLTPIRHIKQSSTAVFKQEIEWLVHARTDGLLTDKGTGADVAYLFWEAETHHIPPLSPPASPYTPPRDILQASVVSEFIPGISRCYPQDSVLFKAEDVPSYLDQALLALGLHVEARTSFITYWLPDLLKHTFIALRFVPQASYECAAPLVITPAPDVVTRVFMLFQGVKEQDSHAWSEAMERGNKPPSMWTSIVGTDSIKQADTKLLRVLEWGGMECI